MAIEQYKQQEIPALTSLLKQYEGITDHYDYILGLEGETSVLFGKFLPQAIERLLRGINSKNFLVAVSMGFVKDNYESPVVAVLPQTGWEIEYPFGLSVAFAKSQETFITELQRMFKADYATNFSRLAETGIIIEPYIEGTIIDYLRFKKTGLDLKYLT